MSDKDKRWKCDNCGEKFKFEAFKKHKQRDKEATELGQPNCAEKLQKRQKKKQINNMNKDDLVTVLNEASNTNEILEELKNVKKQNDEQRKVNETILSRMSGLEKQNNEMKDMMLEFNRNPKLVILCEKLHPLRSLREINLKEAPFKPVLDILDGELPEYANLVNTQTAQVHCKAVNKLNQIQPTAIQDGEMIYFKNDEILAKDTDDSAAKEFINCFSINGYEYAQKASHDLQSTRESDNYFKAEVLNRIRQGAYPEVDFLL